MPAHRDERARARRFHLLRELRHLTGRARSLNARTPVLVDDIISTARTMIETVAHLTRAGLAPPVCVGVHGVFAGGAFEALLAAGAGRIVTSNTIPHPSNAIDITGLVADGVRTIREQAPGRALRMASERLP